MPATANSPYQALRIQHARGVPPNCDSQRSTETFAAYVQRMYGNGVWPDIGATESDADYLTRIYQLADQYLGAGLNETVKRSLNSVTASYALVAKTELDPEASASYATYAATAGAVTSASYAATSSWALTAINAVNSAATSSWADNAVTASYVIASVAAGTAVDARASTSGYAIYAQSLLSEAVLATQTGILTGNLNRSVVNAYRDILNLNGFDTVAAVMNVEDADYTGSAPIFTVKSAGSTEVLKVDKTGSLWVSGSKGESTTMMVTTTLGAPLTMSFKNGILTSVS